MQESTESSSAHFWDKKAKGYAKSAIADMEAYERTLDRVRAHLQPQDEVLELGCGTGSTALLLAPCVSRITASDVSGEMVRIGQQKASAQGSKNVDFVVAGAQDPKLGSGRYDVVMAFNLLHLVDDVSASIARAYELLKSGGLFISKTFCLPQERSLKVSMIRLALPLMQLLKQAPEVHFLKVSQLDQLVLDAGFSLIEQGAYPEHPPRRFLVAQKP